MKLARTFAILAAAAMAAQTPPTAAPPDKQQRDLKYESGAPPTKPAPTAVAIPRSYALVLGIANYKNLAAKDQLQFSERDAESIYSILISGPRATLANMRHELEEWLPSTAHDDDRVLIYFAGHGFLYDGHAYLAPYDLDPHNITGTGYPMDTLGSVIGSR
ncbi:MAG: caspase family protein, partial [Bryobacteraceae bacterium]